MSSEVTMIRMNPYGSETFGIHIGTRPYDCRELDPYTPRSSCFDGTLRLSAQLGEGHMLKCDKCGSEWKKSSTSAPILLNMWAMMTLQVATDEKTTGARGIEEEIDLSKFLPNKGEAQLLWLMGRSMNCRIWKNWMEFGHDMAVVIPPEWPNTSETMSRIGVAGIQIIKSLAQIHSNSIAKAAETAQSSFGWLYNQ